MNIVDLRGKLKRHATRRYKQRPLNVIKMIVIHNSGAENQNAHNYANYHVDGRGWAGIGYHYVIDRDGTVNQCNDLTASSYHAASSNYISIGICLSGNLLKVPPSREQLNSAYELIYYLRNQIPTIKEIRGHKETPGSNTDCPGIDMDVFRSELLNYGKTNNTITNNPSSNKLSDMYNEPKQWMYDALEYCVSNGIINSPDIWKNNIMENMPAWAVISMIKSLHQTLSQQSGIGSFLSRGDVRNVK